MAHWAEMSAAECSGELQAPITQLSLFCAPKHLLNLLLQRIRGKEVLKSPGAFLLLGYRGVRVNREVPAERGAESCEKGKGGWRGSKSKGKGPPPCLMSWSGRPSWECAGERPEKSPGRNGFPVQITAWRPLAWILERAWRRGDLRPKGLVAGSI